MTITIHPDAHAALCQLAPPRKRSKYIGGLILAMHRGPPPGCMAPEPEPTPPTPVTPHNDSADHLAAELRNLADRLQRIEAQTQEHRAG